MPLEAVANSERSFPAAGSAPSRTDVTDDFARLKPIFAEKRLPAYVPQAYCAP